MAPDTLRAPDWPMRARLLVADLVAFDPSRLGWRLAVRTVVGLALPMMLAHMLNMPLLVWVGLGAYLLAIGDCTDDGDRAQPLRICVGAVLGGLALATGVLAGASLVTALAGMIAWGFLTGMMGVYGNAFAAMSLPVAWAYVELGLPAADHTLPNALLTGGMFVLGGMLTLLLTLTLGFEGTFAPVRAQTATCFRELARYLEVPRVEGPEPPEPRVRGAIAEARRLAAQVRHAALGVSRANQRTLMLIESADRLFSLVGALREAGQPQIRGCKTALLAVAGALSGRSRPEELRLLRSDLGERVAVEEQEPSSPFGSSALARRIVQELGRALSLAADDELPVVPAAPARPTTRLSAALSPLLANLDRNSVVARHALRFALVTSVAVMVFWVFPKPFGYWVPLTVTVVLKPYAGMTLARAVQRAVGTVAGILMGLALIPFLPTISLQFSVVIIFFFAMMAVLPFNYGLAIVFLSAGLIPFEHLLTPDARIAIGADRLVATAIGAALALIGGHLLWPTFQRRALQDLLRACIEATAEYADAVIGTAQGDMAVADMPAERRHAGLALTNLQVGVQRSLTEVGGDANTMTAILRTAAALQRLSNTLNAMLQTVPGLASSRPALASFRVAFVSALADPFHNEPQISSLRALMPTPDGSLEGAALSHALDRLVSALEMLRDAALVIPGDSNSFHASFG
jgi:uncharacterized membrane protein YccC